MNFRSDLALERREYAGQKDIDGIESREEKIGQSVVTTIRVLNENAEKILGKPKGTYITVEASAPLKNPDLLKQCAQTVAGQIKKLLPPCGCVLVAGLGNSSITPDALGPKASDMLLATRHISRELASSIGLEGLGSVAVIAPGVLGNTGIETAEIIDGIVKKIRPDAVITVDALAARRLERLGTTVQMCDTGISPGSGVGNSRSEISRKTLGVPVISIGVPTVVDGETMMLDLMEKYEIAVPDAQSLWSLEDGAVMVTPKEIDLVIDRAAQLIAMGINCALQPNMGFDDIMRIVK